MPFTPATSAASIGAGDLPPAATWASEAAPPSWPTAAQDRLDLLAQLGLTPPDQSRSWRREAACRDLPTDLFFPVGHGLRAQAQAGLAKQVCAECAVRDECLEYALAANSRYGVFGGLDEDERRQLRRRPGGGLGMAPGGLEVDAIGDEDLERSA